MLTLTLVGHLGKDATINDTNGKKVINFSVAHSEKYKDASGTPVTKTIWVECAKWGEFTNIAQYLKKGTLVAVTGRPEVQAYKNREGALAASLRCTVTHIELLGGKKEDATPGQPVTGGEMPAGPTAMQSADSSDDLPF